jgi:CubicO group peptidase (beta-lactamase class C family)
MGRCFGVKGVLAALALALTIEPVAGETPQELAERVVREEMEYAGTPAMVALVLRDEDVLASVATGLADPANGRPVDLDTVFPAGSVSKLLTATLVMIEVEAGRLDLDVPVNSYLPADEQIIDRNGLPVPATLRQLLSHSSGLPVAWDGIPPSPPVASTESYLAANRETIYPPGDRIVYSNAALTFAGVIAARAAGMDFEDFARDRLFDPLGMTRSSFGAPGAVENIAAGHARGRGGVVEPAANPDLSALAPAGGLLTTVQDLGQFARLILGEGRIDGVEVLSPGGVAEMLRLQARFHPELDEGFGLAFGRRQDAGRSVAWWDGSTLAAAAHFALAPDAEVAVIVLSNLADNHPTSVAGRRILDALVPPTDMVAYAPAPADLAPRAGIYRTVDFVDPRFAFLSWLMPFRVSVGEGGLDVASTMVGDMMFEPVGPERFTVRGSMLDGATALFEGDRLQVGFVRAERQPALLSPVAIVTYAGLLALLVLTPVVWGLWRLVRRRRVR